jgi:hypothetical protein
VADLCGCPESEIEAIEAGTQAPSGRVWKRLKIHVGRPLIGLDNIYQQARHEENAETETRARASSGLRTPIAPKLTAAVEAPKEEEPVTIKLADVLTPEVLPVEEPADGPRRGVDGRKIGPPGTWSREQVEARRTYARELLIAFPNKRTTGRDSVVELVTARFGVGLDAEAVGQIREGLQREKIRAEVLAEMEAKAAVTSPTSVQSDPVPGTSINEQALVTLATMALEAVPSLARYEIVVGDDGKPRISYSVRQVRLVERSVEVPR